jgi:hypothetical protein
LYQPDRSAVVEHSTESDHQIKLLGTEVTAKTLGYKDRLVKEALEIKLHPRISVDRKDANIAKHGLPAPDYYGTPTCMYQ